MDDKIIIAPDDIEFSGPLIFLAGPIQGVEDWQEKAVKIIHGLNPNQWVASPRRKNIKENFIFDRQVDWETKYLKRAGKEGVILFWLAKEKEKILGIDFAQTTRFEIGEWKEKCEAGSIKLVIGIEDGFHGVSYIKRRFSQDCPDVKFFSTLEETCAEAVRLLK